MTLEITILVLAALFGLGIGLAVRRRWQEGCRGYLAWSLALSWPHYGLVAALCVALSLSSFSRGNLLYGWLHAGLASAQLLAALHAFRTGPRSLEDAQRAWAETPSRTHLIRAAVWTAAYVLLTLGAGSAVQHLAEQRDSTTHAHSGLDRDLFDRRP